MDTEAWMMTKRNPGSQLNPPGGAASQMQSLPSENELDAHLANLQFQGYTLVFDAIPSTMLQTVRAKFDDLVENHAQVPTAISDETSGIVDLNRFYEIDPVFENLMDLPNVFPIIEAAMDGDLTLLGGSIGHFLPPHTPSIMRWHTDGDYIRCTYVLSDLSEDGGGRG